MLGLRHPSTLPFYDSFVYLIPSYTGYVDISFCGKLRCEIYSFKQSFSKMFY